MCIRDRFREFAFTLAGAVTISGVVALTLSPMMTSKLLTAEDERHWLPAHINAGFERVKQFYGRVLDSALNARPPVYLMWVALSVLVVPMWMFSAEELAPTEDQGVIFGIVDAAANATLDQTCLLYTSENGAAVVTLQALDPVYVNFALPQQDLAQLSAGMAVRVTTDAFPSQTFDGKLTAIDPEIDAATRNVSVQATLANSAGKLRPGMYANVAVVLPETERVLMIPATAVLYAPYGDSVFVVEDKKDEKTAAAGKVLNQKFVRLGKTRGDFVAVASGLEAGQTIVTTGVFKLRNGMSVVVDNKLAPSFQLAPKPANS